ncbi:nucleotide pyrophosphohydrolase [Pirellulaceae bacterium SH501]
MHTDHDSSAYDGTTTLAELKGWVDRFAADRRWEKFHRPKNLAMSAAIEAAELMEHFQWTDPLPSDLDAATKGEIAEELSDVLSYLLRLASVLELDVSSSLRQKMVKNAQKYPVETP